MLLNTSSAWPGRTVKTRYGKCVFGFFDTSEYSQKTAAPPQVTFLGMIPSFCLIGPFISWLSDCLCRGLMWRWICSADKKSAERRLQWHASGPSELLTVSYRWNSLSECGAFRRVFPPDSEWGCCRNWLHWCSVAKTGSHKSAPHPRAMGSRCPVRSPLVLTCSTTVSATDQSSVAFSNCCCSTAVCTACAALLTSARPTSSSKDCKAKGKDILPREKKRKENN